MGDKKIGKKETTDDGDQTEHGWTISKSEWCESKNIKDVVDRTSGRQTFMKAIHLQRAQ